jgi:hypothetical protein
MKTVRLGAATAWSRDRFEPAEEMVRDGNLDYICFDSMSEVTMSIAQAQRHDNAKLPGYDPNLVARMTPIIKDAKAKGIKLITNSGWLDPVGAADRVRQIAREQGVGDLKVAAVVGGILTDDIADMDLRFLDDGTPISEARDRIVTGEVYQGAGGIIDALRQGADVVITTRVGDACLYLGPLAYEFGWNLDDHHLAAKGMIAGHLVECGSQVCGGCFADPGLKDVPDLANVGNPILEVREDGRVFIRKQAATGGLLSVATCKEQLLYEVQDPANYLCPDVIADLTQVTFEQVAPDVVQIFADRAGKPKTPTLKALVGLREGFMTEEFVLFAGAGCMARAELTKALLLERFEKVGLRPLEIRWDYVGLSSVHREATPPPVAEPCEVVLRIAIKTATRAEAEKLGQLIDPLAVTGPYGIGKWGTHSPGARVRPIVGLKSALVPRERVPFQVMMR